MATAKQGAATVYFYISINKPESAIGRAILRLEPYREFDQLVIAELFYSRPPSSNSAAARLTQLDGTVGRTGDRHLVHDVSQEDKEAAVARDRQRSKVAYEELLETQWVGTLLRHHFFHQLLRWKVWDDCDWDNPTFVTFATALVIAERLHLDIRSVDTESVNWEAEEGDEGLPARFLFCAWAPSAPQHRLPVSRNLVLPDAVYEQELGQPTALYRDVQNDLRRVPGLAVNDLTRDSIDRQALSATPQAQERLRCLRGRVQNRTERVARRAGVRAPESPTKRKPQYDPETVNEEARAAAKRAKQTKEHDLTAASSDVESDDSLELAVRSAIQDSDLQDLPTPPELEKHF